jgi:hypothetical protein
MCYLHQNDCDYSQDYIFLHLKNRLQNKDCLHQWKKVSLIERIMQYFKDRTESFDDYYSGNSNIKCDLQHMYTIR